MARRKRSDHFAKFIIYLVLFLFSGWLIYYPAVIGALIGGETGVRIVLTIGQIGVIILLVLWIYHLIKWI